MREIAITKGMTAVEFEGKRYDMGNKFGILQAQIEIGLEHPETKDLLKDYIKKSCKNFVKRYCNFQKSAVYCATVKYWIQKNKEDFTSYQCEILFLLLRTILILCYSIVIS